jgi:hypothetical protein
MMITTGSSSAAIINDVVGDHRPTFLPLLVFPNDQL